jgi:transposase-like protein/cytochrome c553
MISPLCRLVGLLSILAVRTSVAADVEFTPEQISFFESKVRPLLIERCHKCHGAEKQEAGLRLDARAALLAGGDTGPAVLPGDPDQSELIRAVRYDPDGYQMPPDGKLPDEQIAILTRWVDMGAPWPEGSDVAGHGGEEFDLQERAKRWSFQPLKQPVVPSVEHRLHADWCRNPIDRFLLAKLVESGLTPAPAADRATLLRRASFDVIGLPPSPQQVEAFVGTDDPDAWERLVDGLLASPHFGERWGRHWLDLVRYAESRGHEFDYNVANAHQYRDYVIRALNADVPYDQFVVEHMAGDLLAAESASDCVARHSVRLHPRSGANESILGTGFWFLGEWVHSPVDIRADEAERFANMIDVCSKTFLGLTVACARCHDHKFDPITTKDFYALQGYLQSSHYRQARFETMEHNRRIAEQSQDVYREAMQQLLPIYVRLIESSAAGLDEYLLAARAVFASNGNAVSDAPDSIAEVAQNKGIDPQTLRAWVRHLNKASKDASDPFHVWGKVCTGELTDVAAVLDYARQLEERDSEAWNTWIEADGTSGVVGDWNATLDADVPLMRGNVLPLTDDPERPYADFAETTVRTNPIFAGLKDAADVVAEPGALGTARSQPGAYSETFELVHDKVHVLIRGSCNVYIAVDSHILIKGPLHAQLFSEHKAPDGQDDDWRVISIDVSRYKGHRAHLEILRQPGEPLAICGYCQSDLPILASPDDIGLPASLDGRQHRSLEEVVDAQIRPFEDVDCLTYSFEPAAGGRSGICSYSEAEWALDHPELFGLDSPAARAELATAAEPFIRRIRELTAAVRPASATAPAMRNGFAEDEYVFIRGNHNKPGPTVSRRMLEVFGGCEMQHRVQDEERLELAEWMVDPEKTPILPRVIVNRIWQHYFGVGIVPTPDDFGYMGQDPSHPELLDWLASELVEHDWSLKHIHRLILTSSAYRMASAVEGGALVTDRNDAGEESINHQQSTVNPDEADPTNRLLWRQNVKRLEGEAIRDAILVLSGRFDGRMYGRSVPVHLTPFMEGRGRPAESGPVDGAGRRSVYIAVRRNFPDPFFQAFDMPNPHTTTGRRNVSNVPAQALAMMNNPFVIQQAQRWGRRLAEQTSSDDQMGRIRQAYLACVARAPSESELHAAVTFLEAQAADLKTEVHDPRVWGDLCHVLLNSKEFLFVR